MLLLIDGSLCLCVFGWKQRIETRWKLLHALRKAIDRASVNQVFTVRKKIIMTHTAINHVFPVGRAHSPAMPLWESASLIKRE